MNRNRDLLFGVLAVQLNKLTPSQLQAAAGARAAKLNAPLPDHLVARGDLSSNDCKLILGLVDSAIQAHNGDEAGTLASFGGEEQVQRSFSNVIAFNAGAGARTQAAETLSPEEEEMRNLPAVDEAAGRYTIISEFGHGGMGRVLLTHDQHLGRDIALKELLPLTSPDDATLQPNTPVRNLMPTVRRFLQEARITGQLEHPSIVPVYETGRRKDGRLYYTMKLVRGKTLGAALLNCDSLAKRLEYLPHYLDLCQAIAYAHDRRVIHRDIKPDNVMVGDFGETVVIDWGLAKVLDKEDVHRGALQQTLHSMQLGDSSAAAKTQHGEALGTPIYMPPEQARGDLDQVDKRSDVYSLGAVLYELLTGAAPFDGETAKDILAQVTSRRPKAIREYVPDAPPELVAICERAMAPEPSKRYSNAKELAGEVQRYQSGALVQAYQYKFSEHLKRFARRNKSILATAAAGLAALVLLGVASNVKIRYERNFAVAARNDAVVARDKEKQLREAAERDLYISCILLARECTTGRRYDEAIRALNRAPEALRNWEWNYYDRLCHLDDHTLAGHEAGVGWAEYSPDGSRVLTASDDATARVWDAASGESLLTLTGHTDAIERAHYSHNGARIVTASADHTARLWDAVTGKELFVLGGHTDAVYSADFSPDSTRVITASADHTAKIWDTATGRELATLSGHTREVKAGVFYPDGSRVVTLGYDGTARVWDSVTGKELFSLPHRGAVLGAVFSADGKRLFTWSANPVAHIWDANSGQELVALPGSGVTIRSAALSPDGTRVVVVFSDGQAKMYDASDGAERFALPIAAASATGAQFSPDGARVAITYGDKTVVIRDATTGARLGALSGHSRDLNSAQFNPDGTSLVTASMDGTAKTWNVSEFKTPELRRLTGHSESIRSLTPSADGSRVLTTAEDSTAKLWDVESGREIVSLSDAGRIVSAALSPDGSRIVTACLNGEVIVWDAGSGKPVRKFGTHGAHGISAVFSPDGHRIVASYDDKAATVWNADSGAELAVLRGHTQMIGPASYSPDGRTILTYSGDSTARLWDAVSGKELHRLAGHTSGLSFATFSPDGSRVLTTSGDNTTRIWDSTTGKELSVWRGGYRYGVDGAAFSPDGRLVATYSSGDQVVVWEFSSGKELVRIPSHGRGVWKAAFSPDGQRLLTMSCDGVLRVWELVSGTEMAEIPASTVSQFCIGAVSITAGGKNVVTASGKDAYVWEGF